MARGKHKNLRNRNQDNLVSSEPSSPTTANNGYHNSPEKQDLDLKSYFTMMMKIFEKCINNTLMNYRKARRIQTNKLKLFFLNNFILKNKDKCTNFKHFFS